jgi:hypothetical protein
MGQSMVDQSWGVSLELEQKLKEYLKGVPYVTAMNNGTTNSLKMVGKVAKSF